MEPYGALRWFFLFLLSAGGCWVLPRENSVGGNVPYIDTISHRWLTEGRWIQKNRTTLPCPNDAIWNEGFPEGGTLIGWGGVMKFEFFTIHMYYLGYLKKDFILSNFPGFKFHSISVSLTTKFHLILVSLTTSWIGSCRRHQKDVKYGFWTSKLSEIWMLRTLKPSEIWLLGTP